MPSDLLAAIFDSSSNVISQPSSLNSTIITQNADLTVAQRENLVELWINTPRTKVKYPEHNVTVMSFSCVSIH